MASTNLQPQQDQKAPNGLQIVQIVQSVAWAFFGVQSSRNWKRDFSRGNPWHFIVAATLMTGVVVLMFLSAVQLALRYAN